jgi:pyrimidine-nucleoside phosphorylase
VLITDMEQPLGCAIGNSLEIAECIEFLNGKTPEDLETITIALAAHMIHLGGQARSVDHASKLAYEAVSKGEAARRFRQIITAQGGDPGVMDNLALLPRAAHVDDIPARKSGFVTRCDAKLLGLASNALGAGRKRVEDPIDLAVGIHLDKKVGDRVVKGDVLCRIHWNDRERFASALPMIEQAFEIKTSRSRRRPLIHAVLKGQR